MTTMKIIELSMAGVYLIIGLIIADRLYRKVQRKLIRYNLLCRHIQEWQRDKDGVYTYPSLLEKRQLLAWKLEAELNFIWDLEKSMSKKAAKVNFYVQITIYWLPILLITILDKATGWGARRN